MSKMDLLKIKQVKIYSIQASSLYRVNNNIPYYKRDKETKAVLAKKDADLELGNAVLTDSLFLQYMRHHGVVINKKGKGYFSYDFIVMKFDYGIDECDECKDGMSKLQLREYYYNDGVTVVWPKRKKKKNQIGNEEDEYKTITYKMLMRNPGKAKSGECVFINKELYDKAFRFLTMGIWDKLPNDKAPIVEMSAYAPLVTATAIDYITIPMDNILILKDESVKSWVNAVTVKTREVPGEIRWRDTESAINLDGYSFYKKKAEKQKYQHINKSEDALSEYGLEPVRNESHRKEAYVDRTEERVEVENVLWDGMGLIDESIFPENMNGFVYLRSHFFKSCLFRGNVQDFFKDYYGSDYEAATVQDMFGNQFKVKDVKVITTDNSIKWIKFAKFLGGDKKAYKYYKAEMKKHGERFAIVKTGHASKWGELQRGSYQIYNSLPSTEKEKLESIAQTSIEYCNALKTDHDAYIAYLQATATSKHSINNVLVALDGWNVNFKNTMYFRQEKNDIISNFKRKRLMQGKLLQYGDNLTLCGNPYALLMKAVGEEFLGDPCFKAVNNGIQCYTTRFEDGTCLAGFRSPHNSPNNIVHFINTYSKEMQTYFPNLGQNVLVVNGIGTDVQSRANGCDWDTDSAFVTNQHEIVELAEYAYLNYPTIINGIEKATKNYSKDMQSYAKMDYKIASKQMVVGDNSNLAQLALSYYYDNGKMDKQLQDVFIICSILAQVAIDSAKREFEVNENTELGRLRALKCMQPEDGKMYPLFYTDIQNEKDKKRSKKKNIKPTDTRYYECPMDILRGIIDKGVINQQGYGNKTSSLDISVVFKYDVPDKKKRDSKQYQNIIEAVQKYSEQIDGLDEEDDNYQEIVEAAYNEHLSGFRSINECTMSSLIAYAFIPNGNIRNRLLTFLYDYNKEMFVKCFKNC